MRRRSFGWWLMIPCKSLKKFGQTKGTRKWSVNLAMKAVQGLLQSWGNVITKKMNAKGLVQVAGRHPRRIGITDAGLLDACEPSPGLEPSQAMVTDSSLDIPSLAMRAVP